MEVVVVGAGLAGSEAAYYLLKKGVNVILYEMKPVKFSPAHKNPNFAELVCSNTFGSMELTNAAGLLKKEMELLDSIVMKAAKESYVPAGKALAVDRNLFSKIITDTLKSFKNLKVINEEFYNIEEFVNNKKPIIIATGPLTSEKLFQNLKKIIKKDYLYFFDAISPIVDANSIDYTKGFWGARYQPDSNDYFNCTLSKEEYDLFYNELIKAQTVEFKEFEKDIYFEGCLPIEEMAKRGYKTLLYGPMKPVGLKNNNIKPYAVVQLRKENKEGTMLSLVGFQTKMKYPEQDRVFRLIPALKNAEFLRYGSIHKNIFIQSNYVLSKYLNLRGYDNIFLAGQLIGVEGYLISAATGIVAAINAFNFINNKKFIEFPTNTIIGAIINYITTKEGELQPINPVWNIIPDYNNIQNLPKEQKRTIIANKSLESIKNDLLKYI
ncbi:MAG: methylenetetrahydrofolate--tRNA-(uracil(54)-C(5))-methyltransferase (FADH(2)-oxidizing) TrmFO [bacterium]|nr:methylenetetrahydrofolate--tRNA-(uracil(54)-C(5))-methyltransferase (FADH(2)-oxidizing) TrmFO [bacterium]